MASVAELVAPSGERWGAARLQRSAEDRRAEERRAALRASQRVRILAAAASCARVAGVGEVTVSKILAASRVSPRTFYDLFENAEDCMLATFEQGVQRGAARVLPAYSGQDEWRDAIRAGLAALLAYLEEEPVLGGFCVVDAPGAGRAVLLRRAEIVASLASVVEQGRTQISPDGRDGVGRREGISRQEGLPRHMGEILVGGVLSLLHGRLLADERPEVSGMLGELMATIVRPYLGPQAAEEELRRTSEAGHERRGASPRPPAEPRLRWTYRTIAVVKAVAERPGSSNRAIGQAAGVLDAGQISKLLSRLERVGLIENEGGSNAAPGAANAWQLTERGQEIAAQLWGVSALSPPSA